MLAGLIWVFSGFSAERGVTAAAKNQVQYALNIVRWEIKKRYSVLPHPQPFQDLQHFLVYLSETYFRILSQIQKCRTHLGLAPSILTVTLIQQQSATMSHAWIVSWGSFSLRNNNHIVPYSYARSWLSTNVESFCWFRYQKSNTNAVMWMHQVSSIDNVWRPVCNNVAIKCWPPDSGFSSQIHMYEAALNLTWRA